jgi:2-oxoglutarate ferredoxin oxidoreductase subunit delta
MAKVTVIRKSCKGVEGCGVCTAVCPKELFRPSGEMNEAGYLPPEMTDPAECTGCENCMIYCPDFAIVVEKEDEDENVEVEVVHEQ